MREPLIAMVIVVMALVAVYLYLQLLMWSLARLSGWRRLTARYPGTTAAPAPRPRFGYAVFRGWIGYNGGLVLTADARGLYVSAMPIVLAPWHPPIFIPWGEITEIRLRRILWSGCFGIRTRGAPEIDFALRRRTFELVRADAQRAHVPVIDG
ncbi:MAG TPA: hypothetical protein VFX14_00620 [Methylomirabilota bacterium]|nr:hypothetical protein [Methylomirabilota bacterium]